VLVLVCFVSVGLFVIEPAHYGILDYIISLLRVYMEGAGSDLAYYGTQNFEGNSDKCYREALAVVQDSKQAGDGIRTRDLLLGRETF
jgi:hypothetical protein